MTWWTAIYYLTIVTIDIQLIKQGTHYKKIGGQDDIINCISLHLQN